MMAGPPVVARWLLEHAMNPAAAEAIAGDLAEAFQSRIARGATVPRARLWYWREALVAILWQWRGAPEINEPASRRRTMSDTLFTEIRQTLRALRRSPGFSLGAIVPIALALALATSVFAVVHAVLLRDLPYPRPDRLVHVGEHDAGDRVGTIGYVTTVDFREKAQSFDSFVAIRGWNPTLTSPATLRLSGMRVGAGFFSMLGVRPALGRDFTPAEDTPSTRYVVILSDALWRRQFGADPNVIDRTIMFGDTPFRVIGVLPASYEPVISAEFYTAAEIWSPLGYAIDGDSSCRSCRHLHAVASLKPGGTPERAQDELRGMRASLAREYPRDYGSEDVSVERISARISQPMRRPLAVLMAAVLLVLAIAGANAASLMIARAADLEHEHALRAALGASTGQLIRQRGIEALLLAATAGALGLAGGSLLTSWLLGQAPATLPRAQHIGINGTIVVFVAAAVGALTAMIALLPALQGLARPVQAAWARSRATDGRGLVRAREALIVADVAIALTLAIGAGVMIRSLERLLAVDPGFVASDVHTVALSLVGPRWATDPPVLTFLRDLETRVRAIPGVQSAASASQVPLGGNYDRRGGYLEERNTQRAEDGIEFERYSISPDYLQVMGIPLLRGRPLSDADRAETTPVMLISDRAARQYWPGQDPIGKRVTFGRSETMVTVVGVVGDVRHYRLDEPPAPQMYRPQSQMTDSSMLVLKASRFDEVLRHVREAVAALGPDVAIYEVQAMTEFVEKSAATRRFAATLLGLFAVIAALMTATGLYGLVAYTVARRTREFGIRLALGAPTSGIRRLVVGRGLALTTAGALAGVLLALPLTRLLGDQLYQTSAFDAGALTMAFAVLATISLIAHLVPVARATRVSPTEALRGE